MVPEESDCPLLDSHVRLEKPPDGGFDMTRYPIVFTYTEIVVGNGYVATVKITGRCLVEDFGNEDAWVTGVHPSGFSAGGENQKSASDAFQREHRVALLDVGRYATDPTGSPDRLG